MSGTGTGKNSLPGSIQVEEVGIKVEFKAVDAGVLFSSDPGNPDTYTHFYTDLEMFTNSGTVYPIRYMGSYK